MRPPRGFRLGGGDDVSAPRKADVRQLDPRIDSALRVNAGVDNATSSVDFMKFEAELRASFDHLVGDPESVLIEIPWRRRHRYPL